MIVTEAEAREHWCPQARVKFGDVSYNRYLNDPPDVMTRNSQCMGSKCMAWRWATEENPDFVVNPMLYNADPRKNTPFIRSKTHGYCGMAGGA